MRNLCPHYGNRYLIQYVVYQISIKDVNPQSRESDEIIHKPNRLQVLSEGRRHKLINTLKLLAHLETGRNQYGNLKMSLSHRLTVQCNLATIS